MMKHMALLGLTASALLLGATAFPAPVAAQRWDDKKGAIDPSATNVRASRLHKRAPMRVENLPSVSPAERARVALNGFVLCRISDDMPEFKALVQAHPVPKLAHEAYSKFALDNTAQHCLFDGDLRLSPELFAGSGYLAALRLTYRRAENVPALQSVDYAALTDPNDPEGQYFISTRTFAQCVVMAAPQTVAELLFSREISISEADSLAELTQHLGPCLAQGRQLTITRPLLFGWLAESLYRSSASQPASN